ncbi:hypothetical protein [Microbacterium sp. NPDC078849]|uniref:hypothetical protein n=1 Tax=unclassified Microbacterium TaxID=2609290 RepID=UPI00344D7343
MRILTVRQPWAWAIIHGGKDVENRSTNIAGDYRGPVLIHAAKAYADDWQSQVLADLMNRHPGVHDEPQPWHDHAGEIIGVVDLVDVHVARATASGVLVDYAEHTKAGELCSPWAQPDVHHLVLANSRALVEPIPYTGALGLRDLAVRDPEVVLNITRQLGGSS